MCVFGAIRWLFRPLRRPCAPAPHPLLDRPEFAAVNRVAGIDVIVV
jgi:hypothetical protein